MKILANFVFAFFFVFTCIAKGSGGSLDYGSLLRTDENAIFEFPHRAIEATYRFSVLNTTKNILSFDKIRASCGCLEVKLTPMEIKPASYGLIEFTYHRSYASGILNKHITLLRNGSKNGICILPIKIDVPAIASISSDELIWSQYDVNPKTITLAISSDEYLELADAYSENKSFRTKVKFDNKNTYIIEVRPTGDSFEASQLILTLNDPKRKLPSVKLRFLNKLGANN